MTVHQLYDYLSGFVLGSSILGTLLPPFEWFAPWPRFQAVYKIVKMTVARWAAINFNSALYPSLQQQTPPVDPKV